MGRKKVEYKCEKCDYTTNRKSHYLTHISRTTPCNIKNSTIKKKLKNNKTNNELLLIIEEFKKKEKLIQLTLEQERKSKSELITTNKDLMITNKLLITTLNVITNKFLIKLENRDKKNTIKLLIRENIKLRKSVEKHKTIKLLIRENNKLRKSVEKHKTMNMWGCSKVQLEWLKLKSIVDNTFIISRANSEKEHSIDYLKNKKTRVDGFSRKLYKIYSFHGDYWHGNPKIFKPEKYNKNCKKTFGELYTNTVNRTKLLEKDYVVEEMWENDWTLHKKLLIKIKNFNKNLLIKHNIINKEDTDEHATHICHHTEEDTDEEYTDEDTDEEDTDEDTDEENTDEEDIEEDSLFSDRKILFECSKNRTLMKLFP